MNAKRELLHEKLTQESLYDAQQDVYSSEERAKAEGILDLVWSNTGMKKREILQKIMEYL